MSGTASIAGWFATCTMVATGSYTAMFFISMMAGYAGYLFGIWLEAINIMAFAAWQSHANVLCHAAFDCCSRLAQGKSHLLWHEATSLLEVAVVPASKCSMGTDPQPKHCTNECWQSWNTYMTSRFSDTSKAMLNMTRTLLKILVVMVISDERWVQPR